ncbi:MAG: F0F1 ATP synthase subunit alpha [Patescibacteria group bacterium]|nr:F0F1 ATP synthase subunit alpha [Patescibacteria group bacterium]
MSFAIIEKLKKAIADYKDDANWQEVGSVVEVGDGIIKVMGLDNLMNQEVVLVESGGKAVLALALNLEEDSVGCLLLEETEAVKAGDSVKRTKQILSIAVGNEILGRVVSPLGSPLDGQGEIFQEKSETVFQALENKAPSVLDRESVKKPLHTGVKVIDSMIPVGRGQRELIIGDRQIGKTALAIDTIIHQQFDNPDNPIICIYVAVGQKESKIAKIIETLRQNNALGYSVVVSAPASSPAAMWYLAPFAGAAIGEYFRDRGKDVLVVYDDLTKHAWAYRQISLLLKRPPGREAYPGDIFYLHSRLLERAAKMSLEKGGGSLTALPIIETQLGDVTSYIPTNVISITDGQIYLESDLFYQGVRPALSIGLSVSRVGSAAQTKAMKKVAGKLRLLLAQFRELQAFVQFSSDVDETTKKRIKQGQTLTEILKQNDLSPMPFEKQVAVLYAALNGHFDNLELNQVKSAEEKLLEHLETFSQEILEEIKTTGDLVESTEQGLKKAITNFMSKQ